MNTRLKDIEAARVSSDNRAKQLQIENEELKEKQKQLNDMLQSTIKELKDSKERSNNRAPTLTTSISDMVRKIVIANLISTDSLEWSLLWI